MRCPFSVSSGNPAGIFAPRGPNNATLPLSQRVKMHPPKKVLSSKQLCTEGQSHDAPEPSAGLQGCAVHGSLQHCVLCSIPAKNGRARTHPQPHASLLLVPSKVFPAATDTTVQPKGQTTAKCIPSTRAELRRGRGWSLKTNSFLPHHHSPECGIILIPTSSPNAE